MKYIVIFIAILVALAFLFFGCGQNTAIIEKNTPQEVHIIVQDTHVFCYISEDSIECEEL